VREGGCGCGEVRYRARGEPIFVNNCHCRLCQRQTGSTSVVNAFFESERIAVTQGELAEHAFKAGSGGEHAVARCAACGTAVFSYYPRVGRLGVGVRVGSCDDPEAFVPTAVVFTESKMPWVALPEGIPAFEQYYAPQDLLAPEKWARLAALLGRRKAGEG
jgi:hypothetical protein